MILVNLYAPPGSGKSTTRADIFRILKQRGINCEEVHEFAKKLTWEERTKTLTSQPYIFGKQLRDIEVLKGKVDVVITDSPLLLAELYGRKYSSYPESFYDCVRDIAKSFDTMDFFIRRTKKYNPAGRNQTEEESIAIGRELEWLLYNADVRYEYVNGDFDAGEIIATKIFDKLGIKW